MIKGVAGSFIMARQSESKKNIKSDLRIEMSLNYHAELAEKCNSERTVIHSNHSNSIAWHVHIYFDRQTQEKIE